MISNCITHNRRFPLSYVSDLNVISTSYINIFKQLHHKNHHAPRASFLLLQITPAIIYPVTLACNSFHISPSRPTISNTVTWIMYLKFIHSMGQISWEANWVSAGQEFFHFSKSKFHCHLHKLAICHYIEHTCMTSARNGGIFYSDENKTRCYH